jgi:hypothetical protein
MCTKDTYILKLLLKVVAARIEASVISGNKFFACLRQGSLPPVSSATCCIAKYKKLHSAIQNERCGMLTSGVVLLHDSALPHISARTGALLKHFNLELFDCPPCSPDLAPSDHHLLNYSKNWSGSHGFISNEELMERVKT